MLKKLLKYELLSGGRVMLPLYAAALAASVLMALNIRIQRNGAGLVTIWVTALFVLCFTAMSVMTLYMILRRFYRNLLGDEGYMMFSLPVTTGQHIASKLIGAFLFTAGAGVVAGISVLLIVLVAHPSADGMQTVREIFARIWTAMTSDSRLTAVLTILLMIASVVQTILEIYAAIAIGHQWSQHRILGSILAYVGISVAMSAVTNLAARAGYTLLKNNSISVIINSIDDVYNVLPSFALEGITAALVFTLIRCVLYWFITWKLLDRRLNLE